MSTYPLTTSLKIVKELQWIKETLDGVTPSSPAFAAIPTNEFVVNIKADNNKFRKLGSADLTRDVESTEDYDISISWSPIAIDRLFYSMINLTGTNGNRENSFTFVLSQQHNNAGVLAEMYQIARGCKISSITITAESGQLVNIESEWLAMSATDWSTSHSLIGTPIFASTLTQTPWSSTGTGPNPLMFGSSSYDIRSFSVTINHNTDRTRIIDEVGSVRLQPRTRDISIEMDVVYKNNVISQDVRTLTPRSLILNLHTEAGEIADLEFSDVYLESYDETVDAETTEAKVISYTGYAAMVTLELVSSGNIVRTLPSEFVGISDSLTKLIHHTSVIRALATQTVIVSDGISILVLPRHITRALATQTVLISDAVVPEMNIGGGNFTSQNFVSENFLVTTVGGGPANIVRAVPTQTITISDSVARVKTTAGANNVARAVPTQTISISESVGRLAAKIRRATSS